MAKSPIEIIDINFQNRPLSVASYMIRHNDGIALIESGPGSALPGLENGLRKHGYGFGDITHVLLTHIHLDHSGAAGELAGYGAKICVHPMGAAHMLNPEKLINSATRIYGDRMETLWGKFLPVPEENLVILQDRQELVIGNISILPINTPGHAEHHYCYKFEDTCFSGDVGAVRIPGYLYLRVPMPPPELNIEKWRETINLLRTFNFKQVAPTHFGIYQNVEWHFDEIIRTLDEVEKWLIKWMPLEPAVETLKLEFQHWMDEQAATQGLDPKAIVAFQLDNPVAMSVDGMMRYWKKFRQ